MFVQKSFIFFSLFPFRISLFFGLITSLFFFLPPSSVYAASCPAADADDGATDGTITMSGNTTWTATDADGWDCSTLDLVVTNNATLTFDGDTASGYTPYLRIVDLTIDSGSSISGNSEGCQGDTGNGQGPSTSTNICADSTSGYGAGVAATASRGGGGGAYGGNGGIGDGTGGDLAGGTFYGSATAPTLFGSSGGGINANGGHGGGAIRIASTGTFTHNGSITSTGGVGTAGSSTQASGGGSGGAIYIQAETFNGTTGTFTVTGGNGAVASGGANFGGGGGGGRVAITYTGGSFSFDSADFSALGGTAGGGTAVNGTRGTVYVKNTATSRVDIFYGLRMQKLITV